VLLAVHLLIAAHIAHAFMARRTLSPVEPSEAMYTLELGWMNAGAIFLALAMLGTLVFGRFLCGWGCHLVALQDLCAWAMRRIGIRPRAFRSRLLVWFPVALAFYMFGWPTLLRWCLPNSPPHPGFTDHLLTTTFWATFPGPWMSALTFFVCGFAAVYLLGGKGFCTYGCPYGALFGAVDRLSPARIIVSEACTGCGQCTAHCTSNVLVHEEVKRYGMVVDPGCMKCLDCVSVCPTKALSFGYASPPALWKTPPRAAPKVYDLPAWQELVLAALCLTATLAFRGLYDGPPLLLAATLGVITAYFAFKASALATAPNVALQNLSLKVGRRIRPAGWAFAAVAAAWLGFAFHSGFVQWHRAWGAYHLEGTGVTWDQVRSSITLPTPRSAEQQEAAELALGAFATADRWGLVGVGEVKLGLAWLSILRDDPPEAERNLRAAVDLYPRSPRHYQLLADFLLWKGRLPEAINELERKLALGRSSAEDHFRLGSLLAAAGRWENAATQYRACIALAPSSAEAHYNLGAVLRRGKRPAEAIELLRTAQQSMPRDRQLLVELCLAYAESGSTDAAIGVVEQAGPGLREQLLAEPSLQAALGDRLQR